MLAARRATAQGTDEERAEREEVAAYVAALSRDLSEMSKRNGYGTLAYLLDMARLEADTMARRDPDEKNASRSSPRVDRP